ncbi:MAG: Gfo/Idh/MocA family oxidoreductase [Casimicrobiaceae bacterium]
MKPALPLRIGVAGLGRAFTLLLPTLQRDPRIRLVAATDPQRSAVAQFERDFGGTPHGDVASLCADPKVDAIYIATPHGLHAAHACAALAAGKHVVVEKPMALTLGECDAMVDAAAAAQRCLIIGPSHSFDAPIARTRALIASGAYGRVRMVQAMYATDYLYRPRRPEELSTAEGGGVIFSQAVHQIDIVRLLGGGLVSSVDACTGAWDPQRPTEGAYSALLRFDDGCFAAASYTGYAHFDGDELMDDVGEMGWRKAATDYGVARRRLRDATVAEDALKAARNYGGSAWSAAAASAPAAHPHFGFVLASCDRADLRPTPTGIWIYEDAQRRFEPVPLDPVPRGELISELVGAVIDGVPPRHDGAWGRATLEATLAILEAAKLQAPVRLNRQVAVRD